MNYIKFIFSVLLTWFSMSFYANAASYQCDVKNNGYSHAANAASGNNFNQKLDVVKSWIPERFTVSPENLFFDGFDQMPVETGDRVKSFVAISRISDVNGKSSRKVYRVTVNSYEGKATVVMQSSGYKDMGPVFFNCSDISAGGNVSNGPVDADKALFLGLSQCQRKYVQQFLKGQGLYSGGIDGKWGGGTQKGLKMLRSVKQFKGLSSNAIMSKLKNNPMC